jgi:precorrin-3B C(17)-methyltransferase
MNRLYIVGFGAGDSNGMTIEAQNAISESDVLVGYTVYAELMKKCFPEKKIYTTAMRQERERVIFALENAARGQIVSLICSGDSSVYGMAGLTLELSCDYPDVEIKIIAGVTAALSGGAVLGSPLGHDFAVISLSDLLTPWELIEKRLECAAAGDFVMVLYNPSSRKRSDYIAKACEIILRFKSTETVCGYVRNIGRDGQKSRILSLSELLACDDIDMFTTVFIGNSETKIINGKMVTPRGYKNV